MAEDMKKTETCRICKNESLVKYLDLGNTPLANAIVKKHEIDKIEKLYPLELLYCPRCSLSQLSVSIHPEILFSNYPYRSSISKTFIEHCKELREICCNSFDLKKTDLIVDIASNDGCLLQQFKEEGYRVLGIDPATNLAEIANKNGIETINAFWTNDIAENVLECKGPAKIITAMNVFAHVDDLNAFMIGIKKLLRDEGIFVIEAPHAMQMIKNTEFDTIYHEHLSYLLVKPLEILFSNHDMEICRVDETAIHGGSIRVFARKSSAGYPKDDSVNNIIEMERKAGLHDIDGYLDFSKKVEKIRHNLLSLLDILKQEKKTVAAYGASAKGNTLLNYCKIKSDSIKFIADDTPEKQDCFAPGSRIPIVEPTQIMKENPDYILLLAWNFAKELMKNTEEFEKIGGKYIIAIPEVKIITSEMKDNA